MKRAWICVGVLAACHGDKTEARSSAGSASAQHPVQTSPPPSPPPARSPLADSFAALPPTIVAAEPTPVEWLTGLVASKDDPLFDAACWSKIIAKVDGYYSVELTNPPADAVFQPFAVHGSVTVDELRRCRKRDKQRKDSKNPKVVVARDFGFFPVIFADLGNGWMLEVAGDLEPTLAAAESAANSSPATQKNALSTSVGMKAEPGWHAIGLDVTSEVLGVPSLGVRAEFTPTPPGEPLKGPVTITAYFASADDAKRALIAMDTPRDDLFGDTPKLVLATARKLGDVHIAGSAVVYHGPITKDLSDWEEMFVGRGKPVPPQ